MRSIRRTVNARFAVSAIAVVALLGVVAVIPASSSAEPSIGQLQAALSAANQRASSLSGSVNNLTGLIGQLGGQIAFVEGREAAMRVQLGEDRAELERVTGQLAAERKLLAILITRLHAAQALLARQLVSSYENGSPDLVSVVLESNGFSTLLSNIQYLESAEHEQNQLIRATRTAKAQTDAATVRLGVLETSDREITSSTATRVDALAGMNTLLQGKQVALGDARRAQADELASVQSSAGALQGQLNRAEAAQALAAAEQAANASPNLPVGGGSSPTPYGTSDPGDWVIPSSVVACESGGQNLTPNSAGASGYYQIIPSTWSLYGGSGPAAYLAPKSEQDAVAQRIWSGGSGWSNWDCAQMLGVH